MSLHHLPVNVKGDNLGFRVRAEDMVLRDLETDLAGVWLAPLDRQGKAAAMTSLIDGAAERLAWIERT